ncbi:MAG: hypothetical protein HYX96_04445 [Chloroflexi bacterium]|nr:hypothetical protein [Chloroflexota bacterium]
MLRKFLRETSGQILIPALIVLGLSGIISVPLLNLVNTGIKTTGIYQGNTRNIYAADAGVQKALWYIKYDPDIVSDRQNNNFGRSYTYPAFNVNGSSVAVSINYIWLLSGVVDITNGAYPHDAWLGMSMGGAADPSGDPDQPGTFTITFNYSQSGNKKIQQMGVWLPHGFTYVPGSSSTAIFPTNIITSADPNSITPTYGGTNLSWTISPSFSFQGLNPPTATHKFRYLPGDSLPTGAAAWVKSQSNDIGYQWDNALWWYDIAVTATDGSSGKITTVKATVVNNSGTTPGMTLVTYELNPP